MDLEYEGREKTVVTSAVPPYISNYQTFLFSFFDNMQYKVVMAKKEAHFFEGGN
jgi:hypothetical protein